MAWKYIDRSGKFVIPTEYDLANPPSEGLAVVKKGDKFGCVSLDGKEVIPFAYDGIVGFKHGLSAASVNGQWGVINRGNFTVVNPAYDFVYSFADGLAVFELEGMFGYLDQSGIIRIGDLSSAESFSCGYAVVSYVEDPDLFWMIDLEGNRRYGPFLFAMPFAESFAVVMKPGASNYAIIDLNGAVVREIGKGIYPRIFSEGLCAAQTSIGGKDVYGYLDPSGRWLIPPEYHFAGGFVNGTAVVEKQGKKAFISTSGKPLTPFTFDQLDNVYEDRARCSIDGRIGFVNGCGIQAFSTTFKNAQRFREGLAPVCF